MSSGREDSLAWQLGLAGAACTVAQGAVHWVETTMVRQQLAVTTEYGRYDFWYCEDGGRASVVSRLLRRCHAGAVLLFIALWSVRADQESTGSKDPATTPFYKKVLAGLLAGAFASGRVAIDLLKIRAQAATGPRESIVEHAETHRERPLEALAPQLL